MDNINEKIATEIWEGLRTPLSTEKSKVVSQEVHTSTHMLVYREVCVRSLDILYKTRQLFFQS
jgi:hypothetical protein